MKTNKLSLVRETILPLSSDELSLVAGGVRGGDSGCIPQPSFPRPRPSVGATVGTIGGPSLPGPGNPGPWKSNLD